MQPLRILDCPFATKEGGGQHAPGNQAPRKILSSKDTMFQQCSRTQIMFNFIDLQNRRRWTRQTILITGALYRRDHSNDRQLPVTQLLDSASMSSIH